MEFYQLLAEAKTAGASDLHLVAGQAPIIRVDGDLMPLKAYPIMTDTDVRTILEYDSRRNQRINATEHEIDFSFEIKGFIRLRANVFQQHSGLSAALRMIPIEIPTLEQLKTPDILKEICQYPHGLVLVTGPTGAGKSSTLAAMMEVINRTQPKHIVTIEDPIEFVHECQKSLVQQREVARDTPNFNTALRSVLRQDPDVILVGELRDLETIRLALTAAETGHLVMATLHTSSAVQAVSRMIDVFPGDEKALARTLIANSLRAVIAQRLNKRIGGGRIAVQEIMICNAAIQNLIREDKLAQIISVLQTHRQQGMQTMEQHWKELVRDHLVSNGLCSNAMG